MVMRMTHTRLHRLDQISLPAMRNLDRSRTVVILPVGMIEEHGDHLPLGTDNYGVEGLTLAAASWLLDEDPKLQVLLMSTLPYGVDAVDTRRPDMFTAAGSVWISPDTLRATVIDLAEHMVRYGFRYLFPISFHGGAGQIIVLDEACAELRSRYPGLVMYEPTGYLMAGAATDISPGLATLLGRPLTTQEEVALRSSIHASMFETSMMLHLKPDLVDPSYKHLRTIEWNQMYKMQQWPGYVGAGPSHSNAEVGGAVLRWRGVRAGTLMRRAVDGEDLASLPRHPSWLNEDSSAITEAPSQQELPPRKTEPESKPAMRLSKAQLEEARAQYEAKAASAPTLEDEILEESGASETSESPAADTKPASSTKTFPHRPLADASDAP
jgi:creatinine amidohydrolase